MKLGTLQVVTFVCALVACGCGTGRTPMRVWGEVTFEGKPVEEGDIVFAPMESTPGPTTGSRIVQGKYEIPVTKGPWRGGVYQVEITALAKNGKKLPNPDDPKGPLVELADNYIPAEYNHQSTLKVTIGASEDKNRFDFALRKDGKSAP